MDDFLEQIAIRKNQGAFTFLYYLMWIMLVILGLYAMLNLVNVIGMNEQGGIMVNWIALIEAAVCGGLAFLLWRRADYCRVEYDYSFTNGINIFIRIFFGDNGFGFNCFYFIKNGWIYDILLLINHSFYFLFDFFRYFRKFTFF